MRYRKQQRRCHVMPPAWHHAMAAHLARDLARRVALPERPADPAAGGEWLRVTVESRHSVNTLTLQIPTGRARSDQFRVLLDGQAVAEREGRTGILARLGALFPRMLTRKQRHEADCLHEQAFDEVQR